MVLSGITQRDSARLLENEDTEGRHREMVLSCSTANQVNTLLGQPPPPADDTLKRVAKNLAVDWV